jgi:hypothetical protein
MESVNPLEQLNVLEKKVASLIEIIKAEKAASALLVKENEALSGRLDALENSLLKESKNMEELTQERAMARMMVDELINSIDKLVEEQRV